MKEFLRRFRRYLVFPLGAATLLWLSPLAPAGNPFFDEVTDATGVLVALLGEVLRMWAWGSNATTGKQGVRTRGPYALMRHPLYVGNLLIVFGLLLVYNNPWAYVICGLPFAVSYGVIARLEEEHMHRAFGAEYAGYAAAGAGRFAPALGNLARARRTSLPFGWRLALKKEYESVLGVAAGAIVIQMYEETLWHGMARVRGELVFLAVVLCALGALSLGLYIGKARKATG